MRRPVRHVHDVALADVALLYDPEVRTHASCGHEAPRKVRIVHAHADLEARKSRLRSLEHRRSDRPTLPRDDAGQIHSLRGEILPEQAGRRVPSLRVAPVVVILARVRVHGLVATAVHGSVGLVVTAEVHATERDSPAHGRFPDRARDSPPAPLHFSHLPDVHGKHVRRRLSGYSFLLRVTSLSTLERRLTSL